MIAVEVVRVVAEVHNPLDHRLLQRLPQPHSGGDQPQRHDPVIEVTGQKMSYDESHIVTRTPGPQGEGEQHPVPGGRAADLDRPVIEAREVRRDAGRLVSRGQELRERKMQEEQLTVVVDESAALHEELAQFFAGPVRPGEVRGQSRGQPSHGGVQQRGRGTRGADACQMGDQAIPVVEQPLGEPPLPTPLPAGSEPLVHLVRALPGGGDVGEELLVQRDAPSGQRCAGVPAAMGGGDGRQQRHLEHLAQAGVPDLLQECAGFEGGVIDSLSGEPAFGEGQLLHGVETGECVETHGRLVTQGCQLVLGKRPRGDQEPEGTVRPDLPGQVVQDQLPVVRGSDLVKTVDDHQPSHPVRPHGEPVGGHSAAQGPGAAGGVAELLVEGAAGLQVGRRDPQRDNRLAAPGVLRPLDAQPVPGDLPDQMAAEGRLARAGASGDEQMVMGGQGDGQVRYRALGTRRVARRVLGKRLEVLLDVDMGQRGFTHAQKVVRELLGGLLLAGQQVLEPVIRQRDLGPGRGSAARLGPPRGQLPPLHLEPRPSPYVSDRLPGQPQRLGELLGGRQLVKAAGTDDVVHRVLVRRRNPAGGEKGIGGLVPGRTQGRTEPLCQFPEFGSRPDTVRGGPSTPHVPPRAVIGFP